MTTLSLGSPCREHPQKPGSEAGGPLRGRVQPHLQVEGAARGDRPQARQGDAGQQDGVDLAHLRAEPVHRLSLTRRPQPVRGYEDGVKKELSDYLLENARAEGLALLTRPTVEFQTDERLGLGEFGIQAMLVRPPE